MTGTELAVAKVALPVLRKLYDRITQKNTKAVEAEFAQLRDEWAAESYRAVTLLAERVSGLEETLEALAGDLEFQRVFLNFAYEASREAITERRRMLAHASAGVIDPEFTIAQKARIERTMRELDPEDVKLLQRIAQAAAGKGGLQAAFEALHEGSVSADALIASGCVKHEEVDLD